MHWFRTLSLLILASPVWAADSYFIGAGAEADTADGVAVSLSGGLSITKNTSLSAAIAKSSVDLRRGMSIDTLYGDIGIDHWFDPVGIRLSVAYWGDSDILDSKDIRTALYWRNDKLSISGDYEYREFTFDIFRDTLRPGQDIQFHANGAGLSARFSLSDRVDLSLSGMDYDYNVDLKRAANRDILDFLSVSRLSLINSLTDYRARVGLGIDAGGQRWSLDFSTSKGEADGSTTNSTTLRFLTPLGSKSDIEFGLGIDDSDNYGNATFLSVFFYFYG